MSMSTLALSGILPHFVVNVVMGEQLEPARPNLLSFLDGMYLRYFKYIVNFLKFILELGTHQSLVSGILYHTMYLGHA